MKSTITHKKCASINSGQGGKMGNISGSFNSCQDALDVLTGVRKDMLFYARSGYPELENTENMIAQYTLAEDAALFNSGMACIRTTVDAILAMSEGSRILVSNCLYTHTAKLFEALNREGKIKVETYSPTSSTFFNIAGTDGVKMIFVEAIGNGPKMPVVNLPMLMSTIKGKKTILVVDWTFLSPGLGKVMSLAKKYGVSDRVIAVESGTKYWLCNDQITLGLAYGPKQLIQVIKERRRMDGTYLQPVCLPFIPPDVFQRQYQIMREHSRNTRMLVMALKRHLETTVSEINYPEDSNGFIYEGAGGVFYFSLKGGPPAVGKFCDSLRQCKRGASFGHPDTWIFPLGLLQNDGFIRVAVGWQQSISEVIRDFEQALAEI